MPANDLRHGSDKRYPDSCAANGLIQSVSAGWSRAHFQVPGKENCPSREITAIAICDVFGITAISTRFHLCIYDSSRVASSQTIPLISKFDITNCTDLRFSPDNKWLAVAGSENFRQEILLMPTNLLQSGIRLDIRQFHIPTEDRAHVVRWSADGQKLAVGMLSGSTSIYNITQTSEGDLFVEKVANFSKKMLSGFGWVNSLNFTTDSKQIVICYGDGFIEKKQLPESEVQNNGLITPASDNPSTSTRPRTVNHLTLWKELLIRRPDKSSDKIRLSLKLDSFQGDLSSDGTRMIVSGVRRLSLFEHFKGDFIQDGKWLHDTSVILLELFPSDDKTGFEPRELARYNLNQEIHSLIFLPDGEHILATTQSCQATDFSGGARGELIGFEGSTDPDRFSQARLLKIRDLNGQITIEEVDTILTDSIWLRAGVSNDASTICFGEFGNGRAVILQK